MSERESFVVQTNYGPVRGCKRQSIVGEEYLSFRGVPYARPPLGDLRFKVKLEQRNRGDMMIHGLVICRK